MNHCPPYNLIKQWDTHTHGKDRLVAGEMFLIRGDQRLVESKGENYPQTRNLAQMLAIDWAALSNPGSGDGIKLELILFRLFILRIPLITNLS